MQTGRLCLAASGAMSKAILPTVGGPSRFARRAWRKNAYRFFLAEHTEFNNDLNRRLQVRRQVQTDGHQVLGNAQGRCVL
jgi:hypothetical protein